MFLGDHDCAHQGGQQHHRDHLEGEEVVRHQGAANALYAGKGELAAHGLLEVAENGHHFAQKRHADDKGSAPREVEPPGGFLALQVQQHDDEDKQHHDGPRVHEDLDQGHELGIERQVQPGDAEEIDHQRQSRIDGVVVEDQPDTARDGQHREGPEENGLKQRCVHEDGFLWEGGSSLRKSGAKMRLFWQTAKGSSPLALLWGKCTEADGSPMTVCNFRAAAHRRQWQHERGICAKYCRASWENCCILGRFSRMSPLFRPYPFNSSVRHNLRNSLVVSVFVCLFLLVFRPFGLNTLPHSLLWVAAGYGLVSFGVMAGLNVGLVALFSRFFAEERWTVLRELAWTLLNISLIGWLNALYSVWLGIADFSVQALLLFEGYAWLIGAFPVGVTVLLRQARLSNAYSRRSEALNAVLDEREAHPEPVTATTAVAIPAENGRDALSLPADALLYVRAADNYVEVFFLEKGKVQCRLLRNSLKNVADALAAYPGFFRCHKSYLVNMDHVYHVSGNAQGYVLHLHHAPGTVPVSRMHNEAIRQRIAVRP